MEYRNPLEKNLDIMAVSSAGHYCLEVISMEVNRRDKESS